MKSNEEKIPENDDANNNSGRWSKDEDIKKEKIVKHNEVTNKKEVKAIEQVTRKSSFIFPQKKPSIYKASTEETKKSSVLNQKDFSRAKETIQFIKDKKWNSALKSASKVKDSEFRNLITWMYLKTTRNGASFNEYKNFENGL